MVSYSGTEPADAILRGQDVTGVALLDRLNLMPA
jgi:hypothetical protein